MIPGKANKDISMSIINTKIQETLSVLPLVIEDLEQLLPTGRWEDPQTLY